MTSRIGSAPPAGLPADHVSARADFLAAAEAAGAELQHIAHPGSGPDGGPIGIDLACLGPTDAEDVVLIVSGTHGVEGYAGSPLQSHWLREHAAAQPAALRTVWLHAFNPFGLAWTRRVNEDNVDLNRNFVDWAVEPPPNPGYDAIADLLVPDGWTEEVQRHTTGALLERAAAIGMDTMQAHVSQGQYRHPTGVFYGGTGPTWSYERMRELAAGPLAGLRRLAIIDLHTGLGEWGHGELILHHPTGSRGFRRAAACWGDVRSMVDGDSVSAHLMGDWLVAMDAWLPDTEITSAALEYGTVELVSVLQALRADAWLWAHGDPKGPEAAGVRATVRAAFADDDPSWIASLWPRFVEVLEAAFGHLARR